MSLNSLNPSKGFKVALFTNCRDEHNVIEWAIYHSLLGFDKIIIYDHLSKIPIGDYLSNKIPNVTVIREKTKRCVKIMLMKESYYYAKNKGITHLLYIDTDEYLVLRRHRNVKDFLQDLGNPVGIGLNWVPYGNNSQIFRTEKLLIEEQAFRMDHQEGDKFFDHVKTLHRLDAITGSLTNPHYFNYREKKFCSVNVCGESMVKLSRSPFDERFLDIGYIAHFHTQNLEDYQRRQLLRVADSTSKLKHKEFTVFAMTFVIADNFLPNNFANKIYKLIEKYGLTNAQRNLKTKWVERLIDINQIKEYEKMPLYKQIEVLEIACRRKLEDLKKKIKS